MRRAGQNLEGGACLAPAALLWRGAAWPGTAPAAALSHQRPSLGHLDSVGRVFEGGAITLARTGRIVLTFSMVYNEITSKLLPKGRGFRSGSGVAGPDLTVVDRSVFLLFEGQLFGLDLLQTSRIDRPP